MEALVAIRDTYGDAVFYNITTTRNLLADLAPALKKERVQVAHFLEMGGYFPLKYADKTYDLVRKRLVEQFVSSFAVNEKVANWVLDIFSRLLGYNPEADANAYVPPKEPTGKPIIGDRVFKVTREAEEKAVMKTLAGRREVPIAKMEPVPVLTKPRDPRVRIAADYHSVAITHDGFVKATGINSDGQCNTLTYDWRDMAAVSAGGYFTVGLRNDGTLVGTGRNDCNQRDFLGWREVVGISAGLRHTVGLRADGTVLSTGHNKYGECNVRHWRNIVRVIAGNACTFGIKKDGRVLVSGRNIKGDLQVSHLEGVKDIAYGGPGRVIALLEDGRIARVGQENHMKRSFTLYKNVKQIAAAPDYFAGLMEDGTVKLLAYFWKDCGTEAATTDWRDIIAIAAGRYHIIGWQQNIEFGLISEMLHPDIATNNGQLSVTRWEM